MSHRSDSNGVRPSPGAATSNLPSPPTKPRRPDLPFFLRPFCPSTFSTFFWDTLPRGQALFLGGFIILNLLGGLRFAGFDANLWWIDLRSVPKLFADAFLLISAFCLLSFGLQPPRTA